MDAQSKIELIDADTLQLISWTLNAKKKHPLEAQIAQRLANTRSGLSFPDNVFVIGTVNVDETTYMFSPKVLDRAHVIEIQLQDPAGYFINASVSSTNLIPRNNAMAHLRVAIERNKGGFWERQRPSEILRFVAREKGIDSVQTEEMIQAIRRTIAGIQTLLQPVGFGVANRAVNEFSTYFAVFLEVDDGTIFSPEGWRGALDRAVIQKVLPKIHGNRRQLGRSLSALTAFLRGNDGTDTSYTLGTERIEVPTGEGLGFELPISANKVEHMERRLNAIGYTTFVAMTLGKMVALSRIFVEMVG